MSTFWWQQQNMSKRRLQNPEFSRTHNARIAAVCLVLFIFGLLFLVLALSASAQVVQQSTAARGFNIANVNGSVNITINGQSPTACGVERTDIKQLKDPSGAKIDIERKNWNAQPTTVAALAKLPLHTEAELLQDSDTRIAPTENTVYDIHAVILGFKKETDQDIHIVIADPDDPKTTMIVEIPAGSCMAGKNQEHFNRLQKMFAARFGKPASAYTKLDSPLPFHVVGVGFFDFVHGQTGHAANGIELHPVLLFH